MFIGIVLALHATVVADTVPKVTAVADTVPKVTAVADTVPKVKAVDSTSRGWVADQKTLDTRKSVARVEEMFEGRFPGVRVVQSPGGLRVEVRGATTLNGSTAPLYVIDGLTFDPGPSGLIALAPNDIARIEVLKDETSLAFYGGSRGANGVVLITTKRGPL